MRIFEGKQIIAEINAGFIDIEDRHLGWKYMIYFPDREVALEDLKGLISALEEK